MYIEESLVMITDVLLSLRIVAVLAHSVDTDEMPHAAFHLGFHCLPISTHLGNG